MSNMTFKDIDIKIDNPDHNSGNLNSIVTEIRYALEQLIIDNKTYTIDLRAMPWSAGEELKLEVYLGQGEVKIELNVLGKSSFYETSYSGVWVVSHHNPEGEEVSKLIEICTIPELIKSQQDDIQSALERLDNSDNDYSEEWVNEETNTL